MIEINRNPSRRELSFFGVLFVAFFALVGAIVWWRFDGRTVAFVLWGAAAAVGVAYYVAPPLQRPLYLGWMHAAYPIGWFISHLLLAIIYFLVLTPVGRVMRLLGHDPMQRRMDPSAGTYWVEHNPHREPDRYFRQF